VLGAAALVGVEPAAWALGAATLGIAVVPGTAWALGAAPGTAVASRIAWALETVAPETVGVLGAATSPGTGPRKNRRGGPIGGGTGLVLMLSRKSNFWEVAVGCCSTKGKVDSSKTTWQKRMIQFDRRSRHQYPL
jgi:hypothetical protein